MKKLKIVLSIAVVSAFLLNGCVRVTYFKETVVRKDGSGKILEIIETERISEPHSETKRIKAPQTMEFHYLK